MKLNKPNKLNNLKEKLKELKIKADEFFNHPKS